MAKLPSQNPLARRLRKAGKDAENRQNDAAAAALQRGAIDRANREQERETKEMKMMKKPVKKYAKGGKIDGIAKKGKTKTKMVKMAMGGIARGAMIRPENRGGPARATFKKGGSCGMKGK